MNAETAGGMSTEPRLPSGIVLRVKAVSIAGPCRADGGWIRCADGAIYSIPPSLHDWAVGLIAAETEHQRLTGHTLFPVPLRIRGADHPQPHAA